LELLFLLRLLRLALSPRLVPFPDRSFAGRLAIRALGLPLVGPATDDRIVRGNVGSRRARAARHHFSLELREVNAATPPTPATPSTTPGGTSGEGTSAARCGGDVVGDQRLLALVKRGDGLQQPRGFLALQVPLGDRVLDACRELLQSGNQSLDV